MGLWCCCERKENRFNNPFVTSSAATGSATGHVIAKSDLATANRNRDDATATGTVPGAATATTTASTAIAVVIATTAATRATPTGTDARRRSSAFFKCSFFPSHVVRGGDPPKLLKRLRAKISQLCGSRCVSQAAQNVIVTMKASWEKRFLQHCDAFSRHSASFTLLVTH